MTQKEQTPVEKNMDDGHLHAEMAELKQDMRSAQVTHWMQKNQQLLMAVAAAIVMIMFAFGLWSEHQKTEKESAAMMYYQGVGVQDAAQKQALLEQVIRDYADTAYAVLAHLRLASITSPEMHLQAIIDHQGATPELRWQARLDLAEYQIEQGKQEAAKALLQEHTGNQFEQLRYALLAKLSSGDERKGYLQKALDSISNDGVLKESLEAQLAQLN